MMLWTAGSSNAADDRASATRGRSADGPDFDRDLVAAEAAVHVGADADVRGVADQVAHVFDVADDVVQASRGACRTRRAGGGTCRRS